jgi:mannosyltransferase
VTASVALRAERSFSPAAVSGVIVAGLTLVGLALRAAGLDESLYGDELYTYEVSGRAGLDDVVSGVAGDIEISPPLYFVFAWATAKLGDPQVWLRVPSFLAGVAAIPVVYLLGSRTVGLRAAVVGAALLALSPFAIAYSVEARPYALTLLLTALSTLALLAAVYKGRPHQWALFALASWAALMSHYTAIFPLAAQAAWAVWAHREHLRPLAVAHAAIGAGLLPWLPSFLADRDADFQSAIETVWPFTPSFFLRSLAGGVVGNSYVGLPEIPGEAALALLAGGLLLALPGASRAISLLRRRDTALILMIALAAPVGAALYSLFFSSVFVPRTLLPSLPALCLVLGLFLTAGPRLLSAAAVAFVIVAMALGAARVVAWNPKPPFGAVADEIEARSQPGDPVLEYVLDFGSLDTELEPPFLLYRDPCRDPATAPLQNVRGELGCTGRAGGFARAARRPARRLFLVVHAGARPSFSEVDRRWRLQEATRFDNHFYPLEVLEYAPR